MFHFHFSIELVLINIYIYYTYIYKTHQELNMTLIHKNIQCITKHFDHNNYLH